MFSKLTGTDSFLEMIGTPKFWYTVILLVGAVCLLVACIRYWNNGGKYGILSIFAVVFIGLTVYSGININAYYTARGGIIGTIAGIFKTNTVEYTDMAEYKISNVELLQVNNTDTYSATITMEDVFLLENNAKFMVYVNDSPCTYVENSRDYVLADYKYTFYDEEFNPLLTDILRFRFAFYTNSTSLKILTNGGAEAVKYWHYYFNKNTFVVKLQEVDSYEDFDVSFGTGDVSNYCTVSYYVDNELTCVQVYQKGAELQLIDFGETPYNVWTLNNNRVIDGMVVEEGITLNAEYFDISTNSNLVGTWNGFSVKPLKLNRQYKLLIGDNGTGMLYNSSTKTGHTLIFTKLGEWSAEFYPTNAIGDLYTITGAVNSDGTYYLVLTHGSYTVYFVK